MSIRNQNGIMFFNTWSTLDPFRTYVITYKSYENDYIGTIHYQYYDYNPTTLDLSSIKRI